MIGDLTVITVGNLTKKSLKWVGFVIGDLIETN
jgi:hypothetical protein